MYYSKEHWKDRIKEAEVTPEEAGVGADPATDIRLGLAVGLLILDVLVNISDSLDVHNRRI